MKPRNLAIRLVPAAGNWLICIACGRFSCDFGIESAGEQHAGVHKKCIENVKARRGSRTTVDVNGAPS